MYDTLKTSIIFKKNIHQLALLVDTDSFMWGRNLIPLFYLLKRQPSKF